MFKLRTFQWVKTRFNDTICFVLHKWNIWQSWWVYQFWTQLLSRVQLFATPWTAAHEASLSITNSWSLLRLFHHVGDVIQPSHPLSSPSPPPSVFPSIRVFSNESVLYIRWPKDWSFSFSISPSNEYSGLISFRIDWLDLFAVQGTLKSLLQHHSSKASILQLSSLYISDYMTKRQWSYEHF